METSTRRIGSRVGTLAATVVAIGLAAPALAQQSSPTLLPPKPLPAPTFTNWPDNHSGAAMPPTGAPVDSAPILTPNDGPAPTPGTASGPGPNASPNRIWTVAPTGPQNGANPSLPPRPVIPGQTAQWQNRPMGNSGAGWRGMNQGVTPGQGGPAAMLAAPRGAVTPTARPDWNWHGYDTYNQASRLAHVTPTSSSLAATDMGPYLKYAHCWHLSQNALPAPGVAAASAPPTEIPAAAPSISGNATTSSPNVEWRGTADIQNQGTAVSDASGWNTNGVTTANFAGTSLPTRPNQIVVVEPPPGSAPRIPLQARERISQLCTGKARNLVVEQLSPIRLRIAFLVKEQQDAEMLTTQLATLAELAPYKVDFEVQIGQ